MKFVAPGITAIVVIALLIGGAFYLKRSALREKPDTQASTEAKAYLIHLQLSDVSMQATENFMNQQVVEVQGKIANQGDRRLESIDVYCLFSGIDGHEVGRQRLPIVQAKGSALVPGQVRAFRLPFDTVPDGWNQAMPRMVIARITFAR